MIGADTASYPDTVDEIAAVLRTDSVLVQQTMGSGDAAGADRRLTALVKKLPYRVYIALVSQPTDVDAGTGSSAYLVQALHKRIARPGLYIVQTSAGTLRMQTFGVARDGQELSLHSSTNAGQVEARVTSRYADPVYLLVPTIWAETILRTAQRPASESEWSGTQPGYAKPNLPERVVADLAARDAALDPPRRDRGDEAAEPASTGKKWMAGTTVGLGVLLLLQQTVRGWPGWRRRTKAAGTSAPAFVAGTMSSLPELRAWAGRTLTELTKDLASMPTSVRRQDRADAAVLARDAAEPLLDSDEVTDVLGALALARAGRRDVQRALGAGRDQPYRSCFLNPLHKPATATATWEFGQGDVEVPVCPRCRDDLATGSPPEVLMVLARWGRTRPYYESDDVWARTGYGALTDDLAGDVLAARSTR